MENNKENHQSEPIFYEHKSWQSLKVMLIKLFLRAVNSKTSLGKRLELKKAGLPNKNDVPEPPRELVEEFHVTSWKVKDRNVFRLAPKEEKTKKLVLFLHGGAYLSNATKYHWIFVQKLIRNHRCTVIFPDYPLAPENTYKDTFSIVESVYKQLVDEVEQKDFILMGDSAGGGLALALAQKMKNENIPQPNQIILLSPWLELTCSHPGIPEIDKDDIWLNVDSLKVVGKAYAGDLDPNHYLVSPINGTVEGLGQVSLFAGTHEIFVLDCRKFRAICREKGVKVNYFEYPKMVHDWMLMGDTEESRKVIEQVGDLINHAE